MKVRIRRRSALALFTALLVVLAISIVSDARMENESIRYAIAVSSQYRIAVYHLGREPEPQWLEVGFGLQWVSRDGFWVGGLRAKDYQDLINFTPRTLYVQNLQTGEKRTYAAVAREVERFAFTDDLRYLAVLGVPHDLENPQEPTSLFLFDMAEPQPQRRYVRRGLNDVFVSGVSFTQDGRHLVFAVQEEIFVFDMRSGQSRWIAHGTEPDMSPSGSHLSYADSDYRVVVQDLQTGQRYVIGQGNGTTPSWSPDGQHILFVRPLGFGYAELTSFNISTRRTTLLRRIYTLGNQYWWVAPLPR
jgi:Tol biopolymer transport system component